MILTQKKDGAESEARRLDRFSQFALAAAEQALESSGIQLDQIDRERLGVYVGSGIGGITTLIDNVHTLNERGARKVSPSLVPMMISNAAAAQISIRLGALGLTFARHRVFHRQYVDRGSIQRHSE